MGDKSRFRPPPPLRGTSPARSRAGEVSAQPLLGSIRNFSPVARLL